MTRYSAIVVPAILLMWSSVAATATFVVKPDGSGDVATIRDAIEDAVSGDGIVVWGGYYHEDDLLVDGKDIYFQYDNGTPVIVSSSYGQGAGITFRNTGSWSSLLGFEFRGFAKGISIEDGSGTYWYCSIVDCSTGIEISGTSSAPEVMFCLVDSCGTAISLLGGSGSAIRNMTVVNANIGVESAAGSASFTRSIVSACVTGALCSGGSLSMSCNNFNLNAVDYDGCVAGSGDFHDLTRFCFEAGGSPGPYYLHVDSPCWAENNTCGVDVGAFTQSPGCTGTAVEETTWGAIKKMYR